MEENTNFVRRKDSHIQPMENKHFHSGFPEKVLLEGIQTCIVTLSTLSSIGLKMKQSGDDIMGSLMIYFQFINQS